MLIQRIIGKLDERYIKKHLASCGNDVHIQQAFAIQGHSNISIGDHTIIGPGCVLYSTRAKLTIDGYFDAGPRLTIITGNHRTDVIGKFIHEIEDADKLPENDADVHIEKEVWLGCNVTVLKGVTIHRGSIVAAGAVVTKDIPPYSIAGGVPAKVIGRRFTNEEIIEHEKILKERGVF